MRLQDRAVAVALHDGRVLVMRRHKGGRDYCVLPGGGVEPGEDAAAAALRELAEETGLHGTVDRRLWTIEHADRRAYYFLVAVVPRPMSVGGPEADAQSAENRYTPDWVDPRDLGPAGLQPPELRGRVQAVARDEWSS